MIEAWKEAQNPTYLRIQEFDSCFSFIIFAPQLAEGAAGIHPSNQSPLTFSSIGSAIEEFVAIEAQTRQHR